MRVAASVIASVIVPIRSAFELAGRECACGFVVSHFSAPSHVKLVYHDSGVKEVRRPSVVRTRRLARNHANTSDGMSMLTAIAASGARGTRHLALAKNEIGKALKGVRTSERPSM